MAPFSTKATKEAHALLAEIASDPKLAAWIKRLEALQLVSEDENWWNLDLGLAVENTMGNLRSGRDAAANR